MTLEDKIECKLEALHIAMNLRSEDYKTPSQNGLSVAGVAMPPRTSDEVLKDAERIYQFLTK
jgi:hypothetical protein